MIVPANPDSPAAESDGRTRARATVRERGKDAPEPSSRPIIVRPRLLRHLDESLARRLTIVLADAGYGKSVLVGAWAATVPCVWYAVGPDDTSLAAFVLGIAATFRGRGGAPLRGAGAGVARGLRPRL